MKRNRIAIITLSALLATTFAFAAQAGNRKHDRKKGPHGDRVGAMLKQLDLSDQQKEQIKQLKDVHKAKKDTNRERIRKLHDQMRKAWESENPNRKKIMDIHRKIHQIKGQMAENKIKFRLDVYNVLTPDQRKQARAMWKKHHKQMDEDGRGKGRRHGRGQGGPGPAADCPNR